MIFEEVVVVTKIEKKILFEDKILNVVEWMHFHLIFF